MTNKTLVNNAKGTEQDFHIEKVIVDSLLTRTLGDDQVRTMIDRFRLRLSKTSMAGLITSMDGAQISLAGRAKATNNRK